MTQHI